MQHEMPEWVREKLDNNDKTEKNECSWCAVRSINFISILFLNLIIISFVINWVLCFDIGKLYYDLTHHCFNGNSKTTGYLVRVLT